MQADQSTKKRIQWHQQQTRHSKAENWLLFVYEYIDWWRTKAPLRPPAVIHGSYEKKYVGKNWKVFAAEGDWPLHPQLRPPNDNLMPASWRCQPPPSTGLSNSAHITYKPKVVSIIACNGQKCLPNINVIAIENAKDHKTTYVDIASWSKWSICINCLIN